MKFTSDEMICACISREIEDGEIVAQGIATPLVAAGYLLAKMTHAPNLQFISAIGQSLCRDPAPLGVTTVEKMWIEQGVVSFSFVQAACDLLPGFGPKKFFRPGQVDPFGNFNNVYMGGSYRQPRLRLPGAGGIPDVTVFEEKVYLYVPRHGRHTFVEKLDLLSGLGHTAERRAGRGPRGLVSDLGVFGFDEDTGRMFLHTRHPGVSPRRIQLKTGFDLQLPDDVPETVPPTADELRLLRTVIDPLGIRVLETLGGAARKQKLREILRAERASTADR